MNVDLGIWGKLTRAVLVLIVVAVVAGVTIWYLPIIKQNEEMRRDNLALQTQIQKAEDNGRTLKAAIDALRNDSRTIERHARETLRVARTNETVFVFGAPGGTAAPR